MEIGMAVNETTNGLSYGGRTFMIAGYLKDFKPVLRDVVGEVEPSIKEKTYMDFKENRGYINDDGYIWIYRAVPDEKEELPWFTVGIDEATDTPKLVFNPRRALFEQDAFHISKVGDLSIKAIIDDTDDKPVEYDERVLESIARATSTIRPVIGADDDFLKRVVKQTILSKGVNVNKYKAKVAFQWQITNLLNSLTKSTKTGVKAFAEWMELLDCDFEIKVIDNGRDKDDPLKEPLVYDSITNKIYLKEVNGDEPTNQSVEEPDEI